MSGNDPNDPPWCDADGRDTEAGEDVDYTEAEADAQESARQRAIDWKADNY